MSMYPMPLTVISMLFLILPSLQDYVARTLGIIFLTLAYVIWRAKNHLDYLAVMVRDAEGVLTPKPIAEYTLKDKIKSRIPRINGSGRERLLAGTTWFLWFSLILFGIGLITGGLPIWIFDVSVTSAPIIGLIILFCSTISLKETKGIYKKTKSKKLFSAKTVEKASSKTVKKVVKHGVPT